MEPSELKNWKADGGAKMCTIHMELNNTALTECFKATYEGDPSVVMIFENIYMLLS